MKQKNARDTAPKMKGYRMAIAALQQKKIPDAWPEEISIKPLNVRDEVISYCGYCLLSYDWLKPLANWIGSRSCLEIMCGSGALSKGLQDFGVKIRATDDHSWMKDHATSWFVDAWTDIEQLDAVGAIEKYGKNTDLVICSWPYRSEDCYQALLKMRKANPGCFMIYIGEWIGGGTASDSFFAEADCVEDASFQQAVQQFKSLYGNTDRPYLIR